MNRWSKCWLPVEIAIWVTLPAAAVYSVLGEEDLTILTAVLALLMWATLAAVDYQETRQRREIERHTHGNHSYPRE